METEIFRRLKWQIAGTTATLFAAVWAVLACYFFWEPVYHHFFPAWSRWLLPLVYGLGFGWAGLLSWWLALRFRGSAVVNFCILMGLCGMAGHLWAVHPRLLEKPPMLQGAEPLPAVVVSGFEFVFYGGRILATAWLAGCIGERFGPAGQRHSPAWR